MKSIGFKLSQLIVSLFSFCGILSAQEELVLVDKGVSRAPIVLFQGAPPYARQAATELAGYLEKISGAKPKVIEGIPSPMPEHAIWVGYQPVLKELFPKTDFDFKNPEEILIAANGRHLVIAGRDRWKPENMTIETPRGKLDGVQQEYGTCNAVYTFLQNYLDVRWFWPGSLGEDVVRREKISFMPFEYRYHPQIRFRSGIFNYSSLVGGLYGQSKDWVRFQRLQLDSLNAEAGHPFVTWWDRFHKEHPDYFALQPDGTRGVFTPFTPRYVKICESNPAVWKQWLAEVDAALKANPNQTVFSVAENDGWASGFCVCENCRAWDHSDGELRKFNWTGLGKDCVAISDRQITFANNCARLLKQRYPDKDYQVLMMAYGNSRPAPVKARPDKNVIVMSVSNFYGRDGLVDNGSSKGVTYKQQYADWAKLETQIIWRPNAGSPAGCAQGQPDISLKQTAADFKFVAENKCIGIFIDMIWEHWATQGPQYYLMAQLAWDPKLDADAVMDDYYRRAFGKASDEMKAYWTLLENTRGEFVKDSPPELAKPGKDNSAYFVKFYSKDMLDRADLLLQKASDKVANEPEIYRKRIGFVRAGLEYTRLIVNVRALMLKFKKSGMKDEDSKQKVLADWQAIEKLCKDNPYAINWGPVRPQTPRMAGLHPDYIGKKEDKKADASKAVKDADKGKEGKAAKKDDNGAADLD